MLFTRLNDSWAKSGTSFQFAARNEHVGTWLALIVIADQQQRIIRVVPTDHAYSFGIVQPHVLWQIGVGESAA